MEGIINVCTNLLNHHSVVVEIDRHCLSSSIAVKVKKKKKKAYIYHLTISPNHILATPSGSNPRFSSTVQTLIHLHFCCLHFNTAAIELAHNRLHQILSGGVEIQSHSSPWHCLLPLWCTAKKTFLTLILRWLQNRGGHNHSAWCNQNDSRTQKLCYFPFLVFFFIYISTLHHSASLIPQRSGVFWVFWVIIVQVGTV